MTANNLDPYTMSPAIKYDFETGQISQTRLPSAFGLSLMRLAAKATKPNEYVGLSLATRLVRSLLPSEQRIEVQLLPDTRFEFPYGDGYWSCLLDNTCSYSPECETFLKAMKDVNYAFIDCGANYGYMSVIVTSEEYGNKPSISIEPDPDTFNILKRNQELNSARFEIVNKAVFSKSGETVSLHGAKHEARSILNEDGQCQSGKIETLALNDLSHWLESAGKPATILKLDVEGVEIDAMAGADQLLDQDVLVIYEEHGADNTDSVSRYMSDTLGMKLFWVDETGCHEIKTAEQIKAIKRNPRVGYDFIATRSKFWLSEIARQFPD